MFQGQFQVGSYPYKRPIPLYEPYMSLTWGYPPGNYLPETVPDMFLRLQLGFSCRV